MIIQLITNTAYAEKISEMVNASRAQGDFMFSDPKATKESVSLLIQNSSTLFFVAIENELYIGFILVQLRNKTPELEHTAKIQAVSVVPIHRNKGCAKNLLLYTIEYLSKNRISVISLDVVSANVFAIKLYERSGFTKSGEVKNMCKINGQFYGVSTYVKYIE